MSGREKPVQLDLRKKIIKGSLVLTVGEGVAYAASFIRNIILARMLTKADFGVAATFAMVIALLEMASKLAIGTLVVQAKEGDKPEFLSTGHFAQFAAGLVSALCICVAAAPLAVLFHVPDAVGALRLLALLPLFKGLEHLNVRRMVREMNFVPSAAVEVIPQLLVMLAAWPLAAWLKDYRAMLVLLIAKGGLSCLITHMWAKRRYHWAAVRQHLKVIVDFGWPLLINAFLMFGIFQGDRLSRGDLLLDE